MKTKIKSLIEEPITGEWGEEGSGIKVIRTTNFTNEGRLDLTDVVERSISREKVLKKQLRLGDIILEKSGGSPNQPVGRVVYFDLNVGDGESYLCNNFTTILRPKEEVHSRYLFWFLFYNHLTRNTLKFQNKTTGILNLQLNRYLEDLQIPYPSFSTQQKIAAILDKADDLRRKDQQLLSKYNELLQSIFYQMFGDPVKNSKKWEKKPLKEFGDIITGNTPSREIVDYYGDFIEWIKTDNILLQEIYPTTAREYLSEKGVNVGRIAPINSLLVTCIAGSETTIGNVSLLNRQVAFNQQINAVVPSQKHQPLFVYFLLYYSKKLVQDSTTKGMKRIITKSVFEKLELIDVPLEMQTQFVELVKPALCGRDLVIQQIKKSESLFQALIQKAFKGELVS